MAYLMATRKMTLGEAAAVVGSARGGIAYGVWRAGATRRCGSITPWAVEGGSLSKNCFHIDWRGWALRATNLRAPFQPQAERGVPCAAGAVGADGRPPGHEGSAIPPVLHAAHGRAPHGYALSSSWLLSYSAMSSGPACSLPRLLQCIRALCSAGSALVNTPNHFPSLFARS